MARFDLYNNAGRTQASTPYLLDVQSDHLGSLNSRVVVPLTRVAGNYTPGTIAQDLSPLIEIRGEQFVLETAFLAAVPLTHLGRAIGTLKREQDRIGAALDRLFGAY